MLPERLYHGTGPGPITPDGCAVDYYATLTPGGEPEIVHRAFLRTCRRHVAPDGWSG
ncbi:hypothetical protein ACQPZZ_28605 [Microbispora sp. CA-135349]|uniref:hypothetical protein n=1 Tax=Microbispora sp. CA-135349 TaxID=3239953 RepID=UPI003D8F3067